MDYLDKRMEKLGYTMKNEGSLSVSYIKPKPESEYFSHGKMVEITYEPGKDGKMAVRVSCHSPGRNQQYVFPMKLELRELPIIFLKCLIMGIRWRAEAKRRKK